MSLHGDYPPRRKKYLGTVKASSRMMLVHVVQKIDVQNMYRRCTIY